MAKRAGTWKRSILWGLGLCAIGLGCTSNQLRSPNRMDLVQSEYLGNDGATYQPQPESRARSTADYKDYGVRPFVAASQDNLSTFSIDVDTGSYTVARRNLREGNLPPVASVRVEEFVNFFRQDYEPPQEGLFALLSEASASPFRAGKTLLRVGLKGRVIPDSLRKGVNLVFLVDTSGSMQSPDKIGLVKQSLALLTRALRPDDTVSICTYAGHVDVVLRPTPARERGRILSSLAGLSAGGSTAMGSGIELAYRMASSQVSPTRTTRVVVCSDGDANVGPVNHESILRQIADYSGRGITLSTVGFGMGNYKDTMMEQLADKGDGVYAYVDGLEEARRLFSEDLAQSAEIIARDVKIQVEFNHERVSRYRLIGYENRAIHDDDFRNDKVDAGEIFAGHTVTALYELDLHPRADGPLGIVRLRYKEGETVPGEEPRVAEEAHYLTARSGEFERASQRFRFTACVAEFAEVLRKSSHSDTTLGELESLAERSLSPSYDDREHGLLDLVRRARRLLEPYSPPSAG